MTLAIFWAYVKKYWQLITAVILFGIGFFWFNSRSNSLADILEQNRKRHEEELDAIQKAHDKELKDKQIALEKMQETLAQIEKQYELAQKDLDAKKKKEIEQIIKDTQDDPEELARLLQESTGFKIDVGN